MTRPAAPDPLGFLFAMPLSKSASADSLQRQLYHRIKEAILDGRLPAGSKIPSSRRLAEDLQVSRNTVLIALEHPGAEGYMASDRKATRVTQVAIHVAAPAQALPAPVTDVAVSRRLLGIQPQAQRVDMGAALRPGVPALSHFPLASWHSALSRAIKTSLGSGLNYGNPAGHMALRTAIARHLALSRGVRCEPAQVVLTEGAHEALGLCVRLLTNPGDTAWVEDPGYRGAKTAMSAGDLHIVPRPTDAQGMVFSARDWHVQPPRLVYTTPSHQYPTGVVMSVARRLELIAHARAHGAWIVEDDYDSEFRHSGEPVAAMQGLVADAPVVYVGSFSKTMFPSLRLGFLVLPEALLSATQGSLREMLRGGHVHEQLAMADFIESGHYARHLRKMRRLYRDRQAALRQAITAHLPVPHTIEGGQCGMQITLCLPPAYRDADIVDAAQEHGIAPTPLSSLSLRKRPQDNGLVLGYGNTSAELFESSVRRLAQLMQVLHQQHAQGPSRLQRRG
ncbi:MAG: PLP-dependent aminotransferase family protein [Pseudomonadota bacterium]